MHAKLYVPRVDDLSCRMQNIDTKPATVEWRDGQPYSPRFDDIYFSSDNGLLETKYVFVEGNDLCARWQSLTSPSFQVIETGFGTGLNFLCAVDSWLAHAPESATMHYTSVEKYPLSLADMQQALRYWPELQTIAEALLAQYSTLLSTGSLSLCGKRVQLHLMLGDASTCLAQLDSQADAWFLDGFAPSKNPDMWQTTLFEQIARLSHTQTSLATFTSAGAVRRGLSAVGFQVRKKPGFGKKREMTLGVFNHCNLTNNQLADSNLAGSKHDAG